MKQIYLSHSCFRSVESKGRHAVRYLVSADVVQNVVVEDETL